MPEWAEEAIARCSTTLLILGILALIVGITLFATDSLKPGLLAFGAGAGGLVAGGGLKSKTTGGFVVALLVCLAIPVYLGYLVMSANERNAASAMEAMIGIGCPFLIGALGILVVLLRYRSDLD